MLPPLDPDTGRLPEGEHPTDWDEVVDRFGWNPRRRQLLDGLAEAIGLLGAAGCRQVWLNGSFVTAKEEPADFFQNERDTSRKGIVVIKIGGEA